MKQDWVGCDSCAAWYHLRCFALKLMPNALRLCKKTIKKKTQEPHNGVFQHHCSVLSHGLFRLGGHVHQVCDSLTCSNPRFWCDSLLGGTTWRLVWPLVPTFIPFSTKTPGQPKVVLN